MIARFHINEGLSHKQLHHSSAVAASSTRSSPKWLHSQSTRCQSVSASLDSFFQYPKGYPKPLLLHAEYLIIRLREQNRVMHRGTRSVPHHHIHHHISNSISEWKGNTQGCSSRASLSFCPCGLSVRVYFVELIPRKSLLYGDTMPSHEVQEVWSSWQPPQRHSGLPHTSSKWGTCWQQLMKVRPGYTYTLPGRIHPPGELIN